MHDVAIIGAGLSGLSAARHLSASGLDVIILEKSGGLGGRAATRRVDLPDGSPLPVDHGAQFFTARDPLFRRQVDEWLSKGICFEWATGFHTWDGVALHPSDKQWEAPRYACREGMSALGRDLATGLHVKKDFRVGSVVREREGWLLSPMNPASEDPIHVRALFCSAPVPQSLELFREHLAEEERRLLGTIAFGPCLAVMAFFSGTPIIPDWKGIQVRDPESPISWIAWDSSRRPQGSPSGSFVLHASAEFSAREGLSTEQGKKAAVEELLRDGARIAGSWMGKPSSTVVHLWRYAIPLGAGVEGGFLRSANDDKLYLIGDGLQGGRVEGAWLSGLKAARDYLMKIGGI
ncbi:MAG: FAD-dependent oxidoreductase [Verrucomicrobiota bacterium]